MSKVINVGTIGHISHGLRLEILKAELMGSVPIAIHPGADIPDNAIDPGVYLDRDIQKWQGAGKRKMPRRT